MATIPSPPRRSAAVQLDWREEDGQVIVSPRDGSRFVVKLQHAIKVLQQADKEAQFAAQFTLLAEQLAKWLKDRADVRDAFITLRDGSLAFVVVRENAEYDARFEDELSELDHRLANDVDLDLVRLNALSLPPVSDDALSSFLDPNFQLCYAHGERSRSHCASEPKS